MTQHDLKDYHYDPNIVTYMGVYMGQQWSDLELWERFFNLYPVRCAVELGTSNGGFTLFMANQALRLGIPFHTFDNQAFIKLDVPLARTLPIQFHHVDLFGDGADVLAGILADPDNHPLVLFCDDGDKPREWRTFGPLLGAGDYIAVHDYGSEFMPGDVGTLPVRPLMADRCARSITRWYEIAAQGGAST
jgi:cephalosporin hydroxylase